MVAFLPGVCVQHLTFPSQMASDPLVLQSHITESSRGPERSLGRKQDLQDARPDALFAPALIATGHRRPGPKVLGQFTPGRAGSGDPQHAFDDQAMISRRASCLRLLWRQEGRQLFPVGIAEGGQSQQRDGSGQRVGQRGSLTRAAQHMKLSGYCLVLTPEAGPVQSPGLPFLRFAQRV